MKEAQMQKHQLLMKQILTQLFRHRQLLPHLAFKGGTCLYFFYGLPRFSVDLDFDWLADDPPILPLGEVLARYFKTIEFSDKKSTWLWIGSYQDHEMKIKIEVNKRKFLANEYDILDFYGIKITSLAKSCLLAHKLCAITERRELKNRDLFDTWWMLERRWPIREEIIKERKGMGLKEYLLNILDLLASLKNTKAKKGGILDGLGQLLKDEKDHIWVKEHLLEELSLMLRLFLDFES
jgi:predicted nucleotidyltransferase component of viral defense system